jgi:hypothetical protein
MQKSRRRGKRRQTSELPRCTPEQLIKHVEVPLFLAPSRHPALLQQVPIDVGTGYGTGRTELDPDELALIRAIKGNVSQANTLGKGEGGVAQGKRTLTNLDELLFRTVCALPNASKIGLACKIWFSNLPNFLAPPAPVPDVPWSAPDGPFVLTTGCASSIEESDPDGGREVCDSAAMAVRYWMTFFVFSVLPAPDSPLRVARSQSARVAAADEIESE